MNPNLALLLRQRGPVLEKISKLLIIHIMNDLLHITKTWNICIIKSPCCTKNTCVQIHIPLLYIIYPLYVINKQVDKTNFVSFLYYDGVLSECEWHRNNHIIPHQQHLKHALKQHKDYITHPIQNGNTLFNTIYGVSMQQKKWQGKYVFACHKRIWQ